jgi:hypothetical protein
MIRDLPLDFGKIYNYLTDAAWWKNPRDPMMPIPEDIASRSRHVRYWK